MSASEYFRQAARFIAMRVSLAGALTVVFILFVAGFELVTVLRENLHAEMCVDNLKRMYAALEVYEFDRGALPFLAFYPDEPREDQDSLFQALAPYGGGADVFVCPSEPNELKDLGLTYIWNVALNGRKMQDFQPPVWVLVEMDALSSSVPPPHQGHYHILYTDGKIEASAVPPPHLRREDKKP